MLKHSQRTAQAWFESSLLQCAASVGRRQLLAAILPPLTREFPQLCALSHHASIMRCCALSLCFLPQQHLTG